MSIKTIGVVGLGYVGLPFLVKFAEAGFKVKGYDIDESKVMQLKAGFSYIGDVDSEALKRLNPNYVEFSSDPSILRDCELIAICVPTPVNANKSPNYEPMISAANTVAQFAAEGAIVVLESTVGPGFTKVCKEGWLRKYRVIFSPERVDPSNKDFSIEGIPKVVGCDNDETYSEFEEVYGQVFKLHRVSSTTTAELVKLLENTFRAMNLAFIHEFETICENFSVNAREVIDAASTKPFGFMPFYPGVGVGGHCIPVDPHYLLASYDSTLIRIGMRINETQPIRSFEKVRPYLSDDKPALVMGVTYKPNVADIRESPSIELMNIMLTYSDVAYYDPFIPSLELSNGKVIESLTLEQVLSSEFSAIVVTVNHSSVDYKAICKGAENVIDFCGALS